MISKEADHDNPIKQRMAEEEAIREKIDEDGTRWIKVYFGGGAHFRNWLSQFIEVKGEENVRIEETDSRGFQCYEESGEKMYRVWVKEAHWG
jgi:hypothetical protein